MTARPLSSLDTDTDEPRQRSFGRSGLIIAIIVVFGVLVFPGHPDQFTLKTLWQWPIELPIIVLAVLFSPVPIKRLVSALLALLALTLLLLRLADIGTYLAFNRPFNPLLELHLIRDGWNLASTSTSPVQALAVVAVTLLLLLVIVWFLYRCLLRIASVPTPHRARLASLALIATVLTSAALFAEHHYDYKGAAQAKVVPEFIQRITRIKASVEDQKAFAELLKTDPVLDDAQPTFATLAGKDVIVVFVESYGRSYIEEAEHLLPRAHARLDQLQDTLDSADMLVKSGWFTSPIRGGRSWLAHSSLASGLKIDNQARYDRLLSSDRDSISVLFEQAGWSTVGVMPAIQFAWPEGTWYEYENLYVAENMQFAGERFGFATMPDQYTMEHFQRSIREPAETPVMATIALLSTHAPWTPLPEKLDWDIIGDGSIFDGSHRFGERVSWKFRTKVQDMYMQSFDYTLDILGEYAARYGDDTVIIILGDHQPAPIINGWKGGSDVPVHIISDDPDVLDALSADYWSDGVIPAAGLKSLPMWDVRKMLSTSFEQ